MSHFAQARKQQIKQRLINKKHRSEMRQGAPTSRMFNAGMSSRLTSGWTNTNSSADTDIHSASDAIRARARDLADNNPYAKKFLQMYVTNIVGPNGFGFQSLAADDGAAVDKGDSSVIERGFNQFSQRGVCDITGQHSLSGFCRLFAETMGREGEVLFRIIRGKDINQFGIALQALDIDRLDINHNQRLSNGNHTRMGVELNSYGRPVAYWIKSQHPGDNLPKEAVKKLPVERVPAADIIHAFQARRAEQHRGISPMHAVLEKLYILGGYQEAAVVAARYGASKMGFYVSPDGDVRGVTDDEDADGEFIEEAVPGMFGVLPKGYDFKEFNPDYPTANYESFVNDILHEISSGLGVSYHGLSNNLAGVNFSSIRTGVIEERDHWQVLQVFLIESFLKRVFTEWLKMSLMFDALRAPNGVALPATKENKFLKHSWTPRRWSWVDPLKDVQTAKLAISEGLKSRTQVISEMGLVREDVWHQLATEQAELESLGLKVGEPRPDDNAASDDEADKKE